MLSTTATSQPKQFYHVANHNVIEPKNTMLSIHSNIGTHTASDLSCYYVHTSTMYSAVQCDPILLDNMPTLSTVRYSLL